MRCRFTPAFVFLSLWQSKQNCLNSGSVARMKPVSASDRGFALGLAVWIGIAATLEAVAVAKQSSNKEALKASPA